MFPCFLYSPTCFIDNVTVPIFSGATFSLILLPFVALIVFLYEYLILHSALVGLILLSPAIFFLMVNKKFCYTSLKKRSCFWEEIFCLLVTCPFDFSKCSTVFLPDIFKK